MTRRALLLGAVSAMTSSLAGGCAARRPIGQFCADQTPPPKGTITARFLGTTSILFQDEDGTRILSDGFVTRPSAAALLTPLRPDRARIAEALACVGKGSMAAVFTGHSHYDHAMDAAVFAELTGAVLVGSASTWNIGWGAGLREHQLRVVRSGETATFGRFELTFVESRHSRGDLFPGVVDAPLVPPAPVTAWKTDTTWSVFVRHGQQTLLVHGSANYIPGALSGREADVVYLGVGGLRRASDEFMSAYWHEVVCRTRARRVILVHWDDFFRGLDRPLRPLRSPRDSFPNTLQRIRRLAEADNVEVVIPVAWQPIDPFASLPGTPPRCAAAAQSR